MENTQDFVANEPRPTTVSAIRSTVLVTLIALLLPLLNMIPTWNGYRQEQPPEKVFMGFRFTSNDHYMYASFVDQSARDGRLFMENRFTTEPQKGRFLLLYVWIAGQISRITGFGVPATWELLRMITGVAFMLAVWNFTGLLFKDGLSRMLAYVFVAFAGGLGWALYLITGQPGESLTLPFLKDAFNHQWHWSTFGSMLMPLWVGSAAIFLICAVLLASEQKRTTVPIVLVFILSPVIWFMHPYTGLAAYLTFGVFPLVPIAGAVWRGEPLPWKRFRYNLKRALPALLSFTVVASYLLWARQDSVYAINGERVFIWNPTYSVFLYPFAYGLLLPLAMYGLKWRGSLSGRAREIMIAWLTSSILLSVNPFLAGVKFQYLVHLPLALFAAHGAVELRRRSEWAGALSKGAGAMVLGVLLFLNAPLVLFKDFPQTAANRDIYLSESEIAAMKFLEQQPLGNVVCSANSGNRIGWLAAKKVYVGHWFLTIRFDEKRAEIAAFFNSRVLADQKRAWLNQHAIRYVYVGPDESMMGTVDPALGLRTIYEKDGVTIYEMH